MIDPRRPGEVWSKDAERWVRADWSAGGISGHGNTTIHWFASTIVRFEGLEDAWWYETSDWTHYGVPDGDPVPRTPGPPEQGPPLDRKRVYND